MAISEEKIFDFFAARAGRASDDTGFGFKIFLPIYSAVFGASIWLTNQLTEAIPASYRYVSDALVLLLTVICIYIEIDNLRAWSFYRTLMSEMTKGETFPIPFPVKFGEVVDYLLCAGMAIACGLFIWFNPFGIPLHHPQAGGPG